MTPPNVLYEFGAYQVNAQERLVKHRGTDLKLTPTAFRTLLYLLQNRGRLIRKEEFIEQIWPDRNVHEANLTQTIFVLRKVLHRQSGTRLIVTVPGRGYEFVGTVRELPAGNSTPATRPREQTEAGASLASISILPLDVQGREQESEHFGIEVAGLVCARLSQTETFKIKPVDDALGHGHRGKSLQEIGRGLDVDSLLSGQVQWSGERLRITAQLIAVNDGELLWATAFDEALTDRMTLQDSIARRIASELTAKIASHEQSLLTRRYTVNSEAWLAFIRGRYFWNKRTLEGLRKGIHYAMQAMEIDPAYALAYVGLADSYCLLACYGEHPPKDVYPLAKSAALKALEIDSSMAQAYAALGFIAYRFEWDGERAEHYFRRAIKMRPTYVTAHHWYGEFLGLRSRYDEGLEELQKAQALDPLSMPINTDLAQAYLFSGQVERAEQQIRLTVEMDPAFGAAQLTLSLVLARKNQWEKALAVLSQAVERDSQSTFAASTLGYCYANMGTQHETQRILEAMLQRAEYQHISGYDFAILHAGLGHTDLALDWLEKACLDRDPWLVWLALDPRLKTLKSLPRYNKILRRIGITLDS